MVATLSVEVTNFPFSRLKGLRFFIAMCTLTSMSHMVAVKPLILLFVFPTCWLSSRVLKVCSSYLESFVFGSENLRTVSENLKSAVDFWNVNLFLSRWLRLRVSSQAFFPLQEDLIYATDPDSIEVSTKDVDSTLSRASRAIKKTSKKVQGLTNKQMLFWSYLLASRFFIWGQNPFSSLPGDKFYCTGIFEPKCDTCTCSTHQERMNVNHWQMFPEVYCALALNCVRSF